MGLKVPKFMVMLDDDGEMTWLPDDLFLSYGTPVRDWLKKPAKMDECWRIGVPIDHDFADNYCTEYRWATFKAACGVYLKASGHKNLDQLREKPYIFEQYNLNSDGDGVVSYKFIFKEEDNGNTYRVIEE